MKVEKRNEQKTIAIKTTTNLKELPKALGEGYDEIMAFMKQNDISPAGPAFTLYLNEDMENLNIEMGFPITNEIQAGARIISSKLPGGKFAIAFHKGPYTKLEQTYTKLMNFTKEKGIETKGIGYELYLNDPATTIPEELETEIAFLIKE